MVCAPLPVLTPFFSRAASVSSRRAFYSFYFKDVVKTAEPDMWPFLKSEFDAYQKPHIRRSPFIRAFYDHINEHKDDKYDDAFFATAAVKPSGLVWNIW